MNRLREFWELVSSNLQLTNVLTKGEGSTLFNEFNAYLGSMFGIPGFFKPRFPWPVFPNMSDTDSISYYDTAALEDTLNKLIDFTYLKSQSAPRLSVGAVEIKSGNFEYFDSINTQFQPKHIMASGALPPGFPPVKVDGKYYWDGGLVSNTPLDYVMEYSGPREDMCIFQVDVFNARGDLPRSILDIAEREKDIRFSSRTRFNSEHVKVLQELRHASGALLKKLPKELASSPEAMELQKLSCEAVITIAHIIRRDSQYETGTKDYEFSRQSVEEHWEKGRKRVRQGLKSKLWKNRKNSESCVQLFDLTHETMQNREQFDERA